MLFNPLIRGGGDHKVPGLCLGLVLTPLGSKLHANTYPKHKHNISTKFGFLLIVFGFETLQLKKSIDSLIVTLGLVLNFRPLI